MTQKTTNATFPNIMTALTGLLFLIMSISYVLNFNPCYCNNPKKIQIEFDVTTDCNLPTALFMLTLAKGFKKIKKNFQEMPSPITFFIMSINCKLLPNTVCANCCIEHNLLHHKWWSYQEADCHKDQFAIRFFNSLFTQPVIHKAPGCSRMAFIDECFFHFWLLHQSPPHQGRQCMT